MIDLAEEIPSLRRMADSSTKYVQKFALWSSLSLPLPNEHIAHVPAPEGWTGASKLGSCVRRTGYDIQGVEPEPMDEEGLHVTGIGTLIHLAIQAACLHTDPERFVIEQKWQMPEFNIQSHVDLLDRQDEETTDIKSAGSFAYKMRYTRGPSIGNVLQATAGSMALGAKSTRLTYIATTKLTGRDIPEGVEKGDRATFGHEWVWDTNDAAHLVEEELDTLDNIRKFVGAGKTPPRFIPSEMPKKARIETLPTVGDKSGKAGWSLKIVNDQGIPQIWESGQLWQCAYCNYLTQCTADLEEEKAEQENE